MTPSFIPVPRSIDGAHRPLCWTVAVGRALLGVLLAANVLAVHAQTQAQLARMPVSGPVADPNAPLAFRPSVGTLSSGASLVNITAPNAAGMSLNQYQRFDAPAAGVVLNNSQTGGTPLMGGAAGGNPNLTSGPASTIVNEVTVPGAPSFLAGSIEVFGAPAAVIVANPSGVTCAGCGVVNTPRLTFTTGTPQFQAADGTPAAWSDASRIGWDIQGGEIRILDNGIEGTVGRLDLLGQKLYIDGPLRAHYLNQDLSSINLAAGTQSFGLQADGNWGPAPTAVPGIAAPPSAGIAIDATAFGAMTAGQIRIVSTDAGFGVNLRGPLNAFQQGISVSSNGSLSVGQASAVQGIQLSANGRLTTGHLNAGTTIDATSAGSMALGQSTQAGGDVTLQAGGDLNTGSNLATPGNLSAVAGGHVTLGQQAGQMSIGGGADIQGASITQLGKFDVNSDLRLQASQDLHIAGDIHAGNNVQLEAGGTATVSGTLSAANDASISATDIYLPGSLQVGRDASIAATEHLSFTGNAQVGNNLSLSGQTLDIGGKIVAKNTGITGESIVLGIGGSGADINGGLSLQMQDSIEVNGALNVQGNAFFDSGTDTTLNGSVNATGAFAVNAGGNATVGAGGVQAGSVQMTGTHVSVAGDGLSATTINLSGTQTVTVNGHLAGGGDVSATAGGAVQIGGSVVSGGNVAITGSTVGVAGQVNAQGGAHLNATNGSLRVQGGGVSAGGDVGLAGSQVSVAGPIQSQGSVSITGRGGAGGGDVQILGDVVANKALTLNAAGAATVQGKASSGGATALAAQGPLTIQGELTSGGAATLTTGGNLAIAGPLRSGGNLQASAAGTVNVQGQGFVLGDATVMSGGAQSWGGPLTATGALNASNTAGDFSVAGAMAANGPVTVASGGAIRAASLATNGQVTLSAVNDIAIAGATQVQGGSLKSASGAVRVDGSVDSQQALNLQAQTDVSIAGQTTVAGDLVATGATGTVQFAQDLAVGGNLSAHAGQDVLLQGASSRIVGSANLASDAGQTLNQGAMTVGNGLTVNQIGDFVNAATVQVNGDIAISARNIQSNLNAPGGIASTGRLGLAATQEIDLGAQGSVTAGADTTLAAGQGMTNAGTLSSGGRLDYTGAAVTNTGEIAASGVAIAADLTNSGSVWGDTGVAAKNTTNAAGASIGSHGALGFGTLANSGTTSGASLSAGATSNSGTIVSEGAVNLAGGLTNTGTLSAKGRLASVGGEFFNAGQIDAQDILIDATRHTNSGVVQALGSTQLRGGPLSNEAGGRIHAASTLDLDINGALTNHGQMSSGGAMSVQASGAVTNTRDSAAAEAVMASGSTLTLRGASLNNDGGTLQAAGALDVKVAGDITNGLGATGNAAGMRGADVSLQGANVNNQGLVQATAGSVAVQASGTFANIGSDAAIDAPTNLQITATRIDNGTGAKMQATQTVDLTATAGSVTNAGTIYGPSGAPANLNVQATGGNFANTGTAIAGNNFTVNAAGYTNSGTVGSFGGATLNAGAYDPTTSDFVALGTFDIAGNLSVGVGKGWASAAALTRWGGTLTNYGSVYLAGSGQGNVENLSSGTATLGGEPASTVRYQVLDANPPAELDNPFVVSYTDVQHRAQFVAGGLTGSLHNRASDVATGGSSYTPEKVMQSITWGGTVYDPVTKKDVYTEITVDNAAASLPLLVVPSGGTITLTGPATGTIVGTNFTIKGADLTLGTQVDGTGGQAAMSLARERTVQAGSGPMVHLATPASGGFVVSQATLGAAPSLTLPLVAGLAAANQPGHLNTVAPNMAGAQGAVQWLDNGAWPAGRPAPVFPDWSSYHGIPDTVNADTLNLELTGKFTNAGYFAVKDDLSINAAKGIDNAGAHLVAGGNVALFGGDLNNRQGSIQSGGTLYAGLENVDNTHGQIVAANDAVIHTSKDITASEGVFDSTGGHFTLEAGGNIRLDASTVRGAQGAQVLAAGNIDLGATQEDKHTTDGSATGHIERRRVAEVGWAGGEESVTYKDVDVLVKDTTTLTTVNTQRNTGTVLDGGTGNLTVIAGGNVTGRGSQMKAQGHTTVVGENVDIAALVDRTTTTADTTVLAYGSKPAEHSEQVRETLAGGTIQGGQGVTVVARSDKAGQGNVTLAGVRVDGGQGGTTVLASGNVDARAIGLRQTENTQKDTLAAISHAGGGEGDGSGAAQFTYKTGNTTQQTTTTQQAGSVLDGGQGDLRVIAGGNVSGIGSDFKAQGNTTIVGQNVSIEAAKDRTETAATLNRHHHNEQHNTAQETLAGGNVQGGTGVSIVANGDAAQGQGNISLKGAVIDAGQGQALLSATRDISVGTVHTEQSAFDQTVTRSSGFLSKKTTTTRSEGSSSLAQGSAVVGDTVLMVAGRDIEIKGSGLNEMKDATGNVLVANSGVMSQHGTTLAAGRDVRIMADEHAASGSSYQQTTKSGLFANGLNITLGKQSSTTERSNTSTLAAGSTVGSVHGDTAIVSGGHYQQTGSDVISGGGDVSILAKSVSIEEAREIEKSQFETRFKQSGLSVGLGGGVIDTATTVVKMGDVAARSDNARTQVMAGSAAALSVYNNADKIAGTFNALSAGALPTEAGISLNISLGSSSSQSNASEAIDKAKGSKVAAGGNVRIEATDGAIKVQGSDIDAGGTASLIAKQDDIQLLAASNTTQEHNSNKSSSGSVGFVIGSQGFGVNVSGSMSKGQGDGTSTTYSNTHVNAGQGVMLESGGDTTLKGAVITAPQVSGQIGGNLYIESLQDTSSYKEKSKSAGFSVTVGAGAGGSISGGKTQISSNYQSVTEQSGIKTGDGGFQLEVGGATTLTGGVISSTEAAVQQGKNSLVTSSLITSDLQNTSQASAESSGFSLSTDMFSQGKYGVTKGVVSNALNNADESAQGSGVTRAAISGGSIQITDEVKQRELTGQSAQETIASLNRDVNQVHQAAPVFDVKAMKQEVQDRQVVKQEMVRQVTVITDEAYRSRFQATPKLIKVECPAAADCVANPKALLRSEVSQAELAQAQDGTILAVNGILNGEERAAELAFQNTEADKETGDKPRTVYLMHIEPANNTLSELIAVAYEKAVTSADYGLANFLGYTNGQELYADLLRSRGEQPTQSLGHSRGTLVQESAFTILGNRPDGSGAFYNNENLSVRGVGGAANVVEYSDAAIQLIGEKSKDNVTFNYFSNDPVATSKFSGGNPGAWTLGDLLDIFKSNNSMHSCYGSGAQGCKQVEAPMPTGPQGTADGNAKLIEFLGGVRKSTDVSSPAREATQ